MIKSNETDKDFFACVLFETQKDEMVSVNEIAFYLIGGSTREMMLNDDIAYTTDLIAEDDLVQQKTSYRVVKLYDALDIDGFEVYMKRLGYTKTIHDSSF